MKNFLSSLMVLVFASSTAFALKTDFTTISKYHQEQVRQLLSDYTLEDSLNIRIELKKKEGKLDEQEVVSLPGIHYKVGDSPDENIEKVLNLYERKVVFIKKRLVSEQELNLVKSSLTERLFLPDGFQFTMLDDIPKMGDAAQNLKNDFIFGAYTTLIQKGQFLWIIIFSLGFILALWILAKVWKAKGEGAGGEISMSGGGAAPEAANNDRDDRHGDHGSAQAVASGSEFETFNFASLCGNINEAYKKSPGGCSNVLWTHMPDLASQIQFFEIIKIQKNVSEEMMALTQSALDGVFSYEKRADNKGGRRKGKEFGKNTLSTISVELAKLKFMSLNQDLDTAYKAIYPDKGDHIDEVFEAGAAEHYLVLYKLFSEDFMNFLSSKSSDGDNADFLNIMNDILTFDPESDELESAQYQGFVSFVGALSFDDSSASKGNKSVNNKVVKMIYGLSEDEIGKVKAMQDNEDLRAQVPTFDWIISEDANQFKTFINALNGAEIKCLISEKNDFEEDIKKLDDRMQFKIKERARKDSEVSVNWRQFRDKIASHYSYNGASETDDGFSKAS